MKRYTCAIGLTMLLTLPCGLVRAGPATNVTQFGAVGDGRTLNTRSIQTGIDKLSEAGGGTLTFPQGVFLSGAIFIKPGVRLQLEKGAVLKGSTDVADY